MGKYKVIQKKQSQRKVLLLCSNSMNFQKHLLRLKFVSMRNFFKTFSFLLLLLALQNCAGPSKSELEKIQSSEKSILMAMVQAYAHNDERLLLKIAIPYSDMIAMVEAQELPPGADLVERDIPTKSEYERKVLARFQSMRANVESGLKTWKYLTNDLIQDVPMNGGYLIHKHVLTTSSSITTYTQNVWIVQTPDKKLWIGEVERIHPAKIFLKD